jgi:hypothetical protein
MFFSPVMAPWIDLSIKAGRLACETQVLVGLRLYRMATGNNPLLAEPQRMIPEKVTAEGAVSDRTARKVVALSRGRVKANKDRRSKSPRISRH